MTGLREVCSLLVLFAFVDKLLTAGTRNRHQRDVLDRDIPAYKLTYTVSYNTSRTRKICGEVYARSFLQLFVDSQSELGKKCGRDLNVNIRLIAKVQLNPSQVSIETYLNVTGESREDILRCAYAINDTLTSPNLLDSKKFRELINIPKVNHDACMQVTIHPRYFTFMFAAWVCAEPLIINTTAFACIAGDTDTDQQSTTQGTMVLNGKVTTPGVYSLSPTSPAPVECGTTVSCIEQLNQTIGTPGFCEVLHRMGECIKLVSPLKEQPVCQQLLNKLHEQHMNMTKIDCNTFLLTPPLPSSTQNPISVSSQTSSVSRTSLPVSNLRSTSEAVPDASTDFSSGGSKVTTSGNSILTSRDTSNTGRFTPVVTAQYASSTASPPSSGISQDSSTDINGGMMPSTGMWLGVTTSATAGLTPTSQPKPSPKVKVLGIHPKEVRIQEGGPAVYLTFTVQVNRTAFCKTLPCDIYVQLEFSHEAKPNCFKSGRRIVQALIGYDKMYNIHHGDPCRPSVGSKRNSFTFKVPIVAKLDGKYDGEQRRTLEISIVNVDSGNKTGRPAASVPVIIEDRDHKATCQSINDPHITTFDGLQYNNYYEGEFILYQAEHNGVPFKVHAVYQKCDANTDASCNCAVAVQAGDDVIVIERCFRDKKPFNRYAGPSRNLTRLSVDLYLNDNLTEGTRVFDDADGKKLFIYLPHGTYIKVLVSEQLVNTWVVASSADLYHTTGLCGTYDLDWSNDTLIQNNTIVDIQSSRDDRKQPSNFIQSWRVDYGGATSIMQGVARLPPPSTPKNNMEYCECEKDCDKPEKCPNCGHNANVEFCDLFEGNEITEFLKSRKKEPVLASRRKRRSITTIDNEVLKNAVEPIKINPFFVPKEYFKWRYPWTKDKARQHCTNFIKINYLVGQLCSQIPNVDFDQEIETCMEDIKITGGTSWEASARDAMKEQCLEEIKRNSSIPSDIARQIISNMCINECSYHGQCINGTCRCETDYLGADCSVGKNQSPYIAEMPHYGLCDIRTMNCRHVIIYGKDFVDSPNLTCHLTECKVTKDSRVNVTGKTHKRKGLFIDFNAVECEIPEITVVQRRTELISYLIRVSNDGKNPSDPMLYIPYDPVCHKCSTNNTRCTKKSNSCIINNNCYGEGEASPGKPCLICTPTQQDLHWTTRRDAACIFTSLPDWAVALMAAVGGSLVGILVGFSLYICCCRGKSNDHEDLELDQHDDHRPPFSNPLLHRNRDLTAFTNPDAFADYGFRQPDYEHTEFPNDGRGVENGVDDTTYF